MSNRQGKKKGLDTAYDRKRALVLNRGACIAVGGILIYQTVQALMMDEPTPVWFLLVMAALLVGVVLLLMWNFKTSKKMDLEVEAEAENQALALAEQSESEGDRPAPDDDTDSEEGGPEQ